jgi:glutamate dehydrogenase
VESAVGRVLSELDTGEREHLSPLVIGYLRHFDDAERPAESLLQAIRGHRELALLRTPGRASVAIESDGQCALIVVTDDMPFLVDSVTAAITGSGRVIESIMHPQLVVSRSLDGRLEHVSGALGDVAPKSGEIVESWMRFEIAIGSPEQDHRLVERVAEVLRDVREAVEDWRKMQGRALALADEVEVAGSGPTFSVLDAAEVTDTIELLRWLAADHFTFLGYREYRLVGDTLVAQPGTGLGILRDDPALDRQRPLPPEVAEHARDPELLILTKANSRSTVHRPVHLDYVGVKILGEAGQVIGEHRFLGLYAASVYISSVTGIPVLRRKVADVLERSGFAPASHSAKDLLQILETFPRDELFQVDVASLAETALAVLRLQERRQTRVFLREDRFSRFISALVYLPRDRYNTAARKRIESVLLVIFQGESVDYSAHVTESVLARLHFVVRMRDGQRVPAYTTDVVQERIAEAVREWNDALVDTLITAGAPEWAEEYGQAFSEAFKSDFSVEEALGEIRALESLDRNSVELRGERFILRSRERVVISDLLPVLTDFGITVLEERPYRVRRPSGELWIYALLVRFEATDDALPQRFEHAFEAIWESRADRDSLNRLVVSAQLTWEQVAVIRAYLRYINQGGLPFSASYLEECLVRNSQVTRMLYQLFVALHHPDGSSEGSPDEVRAALLTALEGVRSLDDDRILRAFLGTIDATLRTNAFADQAGRERLALAFKLDSARVPELPHPRPSREIWVSSPQVEGVHLRFGSVARGGLRWSDRREDFRTEVLGLVKAQMVKNSVIVPVGAKGGFVVRRSTDPAVDRDAWLAEGVAAYRVFIESLLDLTDNRGADGSVIPPIGVVRRDGDDPYLVVAADKGTATFSDIANEISVRRGFWLGDAFASGGSHGYDHKGMGITARGAWVSVEHHFRELGLDVAVDPFSAVGIGDMSGDVFGNGMLLAPQMRLLAAFDHRHIFLDPDPDTERAFGERVRLFSLPRSSWADYSPELISRGGGVFARSDKSIPITPEVRAALGIAADVAEMAPHVLISAILTAPVDLLWNGGIGTYVKASHESHADVGDKANDALRVDGRDLRCRVVGEGGNLGFTQSGRVEYALAGGRINTDAIDNSAGVDTSDHEVNLKILFAPLLQSGALGFDERNAILASMTDEVAEAVLADNRAQNLLLGVAHHQAASMLPIHRRMITWLGHEVGLDRRVESLPTDTELAARASEGRGLTRSELAVLAAYVKILMTREVLASSLPDDPWWNGLLHSYFPSAVQERFADQIDAHPLRREIVSTMISNDVVNGGGITMIYRILEETNAPLPDIIRAYAIATSVFDSRDFLHAVEAIDDLQTRYDAIIEFRRLAERAVRWIVPWQRPDDSIGPLVERYRDAALAVRDQLQMLLRGTEAVRLRTDADTWRSRGVDAVLAQRIAGLLDTYSALDIADIASEGSSVHEVASVYFTLSELFDIDALLVRVTQLPRGDRWESLARSSMRADLYAALADLTRSVLRSSAHSLADWQHQNEVVLTRVRSILDEVRAADTVDLALLSVALRTIRGSLVRHRD